MESFLYWWNHLPENINPIFLKLGSFEIRYYGLMYFLSVLAVYVLLIYRTKNNKNGFTKEIIEDYVTWAIIGVLLGSRLGYVIFYNLQYFLQHPLEIFLPFRFTESGMHYTGISGMSYHGGLIGIILASFGFCRRHKLNLWRFADFVVPAVPLGYTLGRIGNFLNGELYGRVTDVPWGMYFTMAPTFELRHPSQLYEAFFEGIVLFVILWRLRDKKVFDGFLLAIYLIIYGSVRFVIEYVREPDGHLGFIVGSLTVGQMLCSVMILIGGFVLIKKIKIASLK